MKLSTAIQGYWLDKQLDFSPNTVEAYSRVFARLIAFVEDADIGAVTSDDIRRFLIHLRTEYKLSRRSVHDAWVPLSSLWTWAERELEIPHIIRGRVAAPSFTKQTIEPLTEDEVRALLRVTDYRRPHTLPSGRRIKLKRYTAARDRAIVLTLLDSGIRVSELCALRIDDYNQDRGRLHIRHGKGDKSRFAVVGQRTRKAIWAYMVTREGAPGTAPLFATQSGRPMRRDNVRHMLVRLGNAANVRNVHPHRFRHTFAINFLRNGGSPLLLQELLGHERLETVLIYVKLAERDIDAGQKHSPADNWRL